MSSGAGHQLDRSFDTLDHGHLQEILRRRVRDGVLLRLVGKWLHAGVLEWGAVTRPEAGTPQGGVISPLLANIYLHEVLDLWFVREVQPRLAGRAFLTRYADDFVLGFTHERDARRVLDVLPKRFARFGLTLHPDKTRLVALPRPDRRDPPDEGGTGNGPARRGFDLLGFTLYWAKSQRGWWVIKCKTATDRLTRTLRRIRTWCRVNRHRPVEEQHRMLLRQIRGHAAYFAVPGNVGPVSRLVYEVTRCWRKWLDRRSQRARMNWTRMNGLLERFPLTWRARPVA